MVGEEATSVCQAAGLALWAPGQGYGQGGGLENGQEDGLALLAPGQGNDQLPGEVAWVLGQQGTAPARTEMARIQEV